MLKGRSVITRLTAFLLVAVCFLCVAASPLNYFGLVISSAASDSKVKGYEDTIANLKNEQKAYEEKIKEARENAEGYLQQKELLDKQIALLNEEIHISAVLLAEYDNSISAKEADIKEKQEAFDARFEKYKDRLRTSYENSRLGYLTMLFKAKSISDFVVSVERMMNMLVYDKRIMKQMDEEKAALASEKAALEELKSSQQSVLDGLEFSETELKRKAEAVEKLYNETLQNETALEKMLSESKRAQEKAEKELDAYLKELANKNNSGVYEGGAFSWPLPNNQNRLTSKHGWRSYWINGKYVTDKHRGIDIGCPSGTPVYACADGKVEIAGWNDSYGNYVVISHGSGYTTLYAHNSYLNVKQGQKVTRGQQIAVSGASGNVNGAHLHLEISKNGVLQDPLANGLLNHPTLVDLAG